MKTNIKDIATIIAAAIWADGVFEDSERVAVDQISEALELDQKAFAKEVDKAVDVLSKKDDNGVNASLTEACERVDDEEAPIIIEAVLQVLVCDGTLSRDEVITLTGISEALGLEMADVILMLCDMVKEEQDITIDFE